MGFEPTVSASERPQTYALDRAATGTGCTPIKLHSLKCINETIQATPGRILVSSDEDDWKNLSEMDPAICGIL